VLLGTAVIVAYAVVSARSLGFFEWSIDEGMYLMRARMMGHGFRLYEDIWFNHPPLLVLLVQRVFLVFGESVELARWVAIGFALLGLMATLWLARLLDAWPGALVSALCLAAAPLFFSLSRAIMSSLPALCAGALALAAAMAARRWAYARARISLRMGAGLALGIGAAVKLIVLPLIVPLALIVLAPDGWLEESRSQPLPALRRRALHLLLVGGVASIPVVASFAAFGWQALWNQAVGSLFGARSAYSLDIVTNIQDVLEWASEGHLGLAALGIHGVARGAARNRAWRVMWVWLGASGLAVLLQAPLWSHHLVMLVFPLAVGAGPAAVWVAGDLARWIGAARAGLTRSVRVEPGAAGWSRAHDPGWRAFGALAMFAYLLVLPVVVKRDVRSTESTSDDPWLALELIQAEVPMGSYAVTDSPMLAFRAGLLVPPNLTDPGAKRFQRQGRVQVGRHDVTGADMVHVLAGRHAPEILDRPGGPAGDVARQLLHDGGRALAPPVGDRIGHFRPVSDRHALDRVKRAISDGPPDIGRRPIRAGLDEEIVEKLCDTFFHRGTFARQHRHQLLQRRVLVGIPQPVQCRQKRIERLRRDAGHAITSSLSSGPAPSVRLSAPCSVPPVSRAGPAISRAKALAADCAPPSRCSRSISTARTPPTP